MNKEEKMYRDVNSRLPNKIFDWIDEKVTSGEFSSRSEVIRYCIRKQYEREREMFHDFKKLEALAQKQEDLNELVKLMMTLLKKHFQIDICLE